MVKQNSTSPLEQNKPTYVLGISCFFHDASATLLRDGEIIGAAQEEQFTRVKHDASFPKLAINWLLRANNITIADIDYVAFYEKPFLKFERFMESCVQYFPKSFELFVLSIPYWIKDKLQVRKHLKKIGFKKEIYFVEHHLAHASSAYYLSGFNDAAYLVIDGVGEFETISFGVCNRNNIQKLESIHFPNSIGLFYSTITAYLGFSVNNSEYKVMGLAAYGDSTDANPYYEKLKQVFDPISCKINTDYVDYEYKMNMPSKKLKELLAQDNINIQHQQYSASEPSKQSSDIAAALQRITEEAIFNVCKYVYEKTKTQNLVYAGGVALNSVANAKLDKKTSFRTIWIQPNASDGGTSMGAALYLYHHILGFANPKKMSHAYLGPGFRTTDIEAFLVDNAITFTKVSEHDLYRETAKILTAGNVIGWVQGRAEWGPRALGARSILASATIPDIVNILNTKVKHREPFRPFAPIILDEDANTYFNVSQIFSSKKRNEEYSKPSDFMLMVYQTKPEWQEKLSAITHVDNTARVQTVPSYYAEIDSIAANRIRKLLEFIKMNFEIPLLINTSFNIRGEPICCSPLDAFRCMMGTNIDYLIIDTFIIKRSENLEFAWDSSIDAQD
jgi:carbamoyltransferase